MEMVMEMVDMEVELVMNMDKETGTKDERNRSTTSPAMMRYNHYDQLHQQSTLDRHNHNNHDDLPHQHQQHLPHQRLDPHQQ